MIDTPTKMWEILIQIVDISTESFEILTKMF